MLINVQNEILFKKVIYTPELYLGQSGNVHLVQCTIQKWTLAILTIV